jgi:two-component system cell cycle sensor histidine kinase/response regulator CckA
MVAPDLGTIEADRGEVEQVLMNLVVNARDAMPEGGNVLLQTSNTTVDRIQGTHLGIPPGRYVVLSVSDTGCGMTAAVQDRIFEPFFTTKDVDKGTGLGLATVFGIVKQCGGGIEVLSELGRGTSFQVYWPRVDVVAPLVVHAPFVAPRGTGTVLLVEDDQQLREILGRYLTSWGYTLLQATNGKMALEVVRGYSGQIDVVLTDLVMPGLDGRSLSRQVLVEQPKAKIVFMSGYTEHAAIKNAELSSDDLVMLKPFSAETLSETLRHALSLH